MKIFKKPTLLLFLIIIFSSALRFYKLGEIPAGFHPDAASQAYNAFSILKTGKDRYGEAFPILFRSFGTYQPPIYTYLTTVPILIFGNTVFSARFLSALSGVILVLLTYFIVKALVTSKDKHKLALISSSVIGLSPWAIVLSRMTIEANLALVIFVLSIYLFTVSLKEIYFFPIASFFLGLSTHAYYSERIIAPIFLIFFVYLFRQHFINRKKWVIVGFLVFALIQIPHLLIMNSGAFTRRFDQMSYINSEILTNSSEGQFPSKNILKLVGMFIGHYITYFSPKYLFSGTSQGIGRLMPDLSSFYSWFIIPFFLGFRFLFKSKNKNLIQLVIALLLISPIPAALTGDVFSFRILEFLWVISLIISMGVFTLVHLLRSRLARMSVIVLFSYSLLTLYVSYFILYKYETSDNFGYSYVLLVDTLNKFKDKKIVIDTGRDVGSGVRIAYFKKIDPTILQNQLRNQLKSPYYSSDVNIDETYTIDNIQVRPIDWVRDSCTKNLIMVGDKLAISDDQVKKHNLDLQFTVDSIERKPHLFGYITKQDPNCAKLK